MQTYKHTNIQTYKHTSIQTNKDTNIQAYKHTNQSEKHHSRPKSTPCPAERKTSGASFVLVSSFGSSTKALVQSRLLRASGSVLRARQTTMVDTFQAEIIAITSAFLLLFFVCGAALLQSRLIKAAGHWQQHRASIIQARNHTLLARTTTTSSSSIDCTRSDDEAPGLAAAIPCSGGSDNDEVE